MPKLCKLHTVTLCPVVVRIVVVRILPAATSALCGGSAQTERFTQVITPPVALSGLADQNAKCVCDERSASMLMETGVPWTSCAQKTSTNDRLRSTPAHFKAKS